MKSLSRGGILWTFLSSPILMKSLRLSLITSLCASYVVKPPLVAFPTLWDCSRRESEAAERDELLLVEEEPICLATLSPEVLVDEEALLSEEELLTEDDELRDDDEFLTDEDEPLEEDELLDTPELLRRLLSCEPPLSFPREEDLDEDELLDTLELLLRLLSCEPPDTENPELLVEEELTLLVEAEPEFLADDEPELLVEEELLDDERVCNDVVLLLEPEERLSCEYESTGDAIRANATADAIAMFRMFFMMIRC